MMRSQGRERTIQGYVGSDGSTVFGVGFKAEHVGTGSYTLRFTPPFKKSITSIIVTGSNAFMTLGGYYAKDRVDINGSASIGSGRDTAFTFIATGVD